VVITVSTGIADSASLTPLRQGRHRGRRHLLTETPAPAAGRRPSGTGLAGLLGIGSQTALQATLNTGCSNRVEADVVEVADPQTGVAVYQTIGASGWALYGGTSAPRPARKL
jgi:hypothetical protein